MEKRGVEGLKKEELVKEKLQRSLIWMWLWLARLWMGVMVTEMKTKGGSSFAPGSLSAGSNVKKFANMPQRLSGPFDLRNCPITKRDISNFSSSKWQQQWSLR